MPHHVLRRSRLAAVALAALASVAVVSSASAQVPDDRPTLDVPYVPTPPEVVDLMLRMADVGPSDYVIDLGSGDGRIAIAAARLGARAFGVDIDPQRVEEAEANAKKAGLPNKVTFKRQNLFETNIGDATVLTMYLLTKVNMDLRPRILDELKPGTRVVSHAFALGEWRPDKQSQLAYRHVYMWTVPAKVGGRWQLEIGSSALVLELEQQFQFFRGSAQASGGQALDVREGQLKGTEVRFLLTDGRRLHGQVAGERMEGLPQSPDNSVGNWRAKRVP